MNRREKKKELKKIYLCIAGLVILAIIATFLIINLVKLKNEDKNTNIEETAENPITQEEILPEEEITEDIEAEETEENTEVEEEIEEYSSEEKSMDEINQEEANKEKAIEIAQNNWGEDNTVKFEINSIDSDGIYIISVRDKATTHEIDRCYVNLNTNTCTY